MNKNYERCTHCNRRKWLTTGCLRKWLKPMECKHLQRTIDNKRDLSNTDIVNCVFLPERKPSVNTNMFVKFWKNRLLITGSVRSLQRYFSKNTVDYASITKSEPCTSSEKRISIGCEGKKEAESSKQAIKCQHSDGHSVLRGHHQHASLETCAIYCQLSK